MGAGARWGADNPFWKGGRTVDPRGYVLVKMPEHHLADVRGYVYEHRLVAEATIGRRLRRGEVVHHRNEIKTDNRPENLLVCQSRAHHFVHHRKRNMGRRLPGEENAATVCECGCGTAFFRFDEQGRPRRFVSGHNLHHLGRS